MIHNSYVILFSEIAHATEILAERVSSYDKRIEDTKGEETANKMHDDFVELYDKIKNKDFNSDNLTRGDYAKLLVGTYVLVNNLADRIAEEQKALQGYKIDVVPKLQRIMEETSNDEEAIKLANELFVIKEEKNDKKEIN